MSDSKKIKTQHDEPRHLARERGKARRLAMQAIYQWQMTGDNITDIKQQFFDAKKLSDKTNTVDSGYFSELVSGVCGSVSTLDPLLEKYMSRLIESVDPVERAILRLGAYELVNRLDVPYRVILNEAVNIAKKFCAEKSHTFVNAVLDKVAKEIRTIEIQSR